MTDLYVLPAFSLTLLAGLSTVLGSIAALPGRKSRGQGRFLSLSLAFSAGVMLYISMVEIYSKARAALEGALPPKESAGLTALLFLAGMLLMALLEKLVPCPVPAASSGQEDHRRTAVFTAFAIGLHNFPEGLVTFLTALTDPAAALPVAFAIAIHNLPEGVAVAVTVRRAGGSFRAALRYAALSGLAEPVGALLGWLLLRPLMGPAAVGTMFALVAGIMVYLSLFRLLPPAEERDFPAVLALLGGMALMAWSLVLFL